MPADTPHRRLAAILAADVVGYSRLMGDDEEGTLAALTAHRADLIEPAIAEHRGRLFKTTGDGLLVEFASVVDAVRCAAAIQDGMRERTTDVAEDRRITFRIGVNLGDVIVQDDDVFGDGVNVAARLEGLAEPGGVVISGMVHEAVRGKLDFGFDDLGARQVKNIAEPVRAYRLAARQPEISTPVEAVFALPSLAVLPFANMSGDDEQEYFSDGVTEDLITALSRVRQLRVVARNSTFSYKGTSPDVRKVADDLGVRYIVEGSVRKAGRRIRVTAQLIDGRSGEHLWAERYDRDLEGVFEVQDELVETIVGTLEPELNKAEIQRSRSKHPENLDAWDFYQRGMWHFQQRTREGVEDARRCIERAIEINPDLGPAYSCLANIVVFERLVDMRNVTDDEMEQAVKTARKAVEIDDTDASAWCWLGRTHTFSRSPELAFAELRKAIELDPSFALAYYGLGATLLLTGRAGDAMEHFRTAIRLSPRDPWIGSMMGRMAEAHLFVEDHEEAVRWGHQATLRPGAGASLWTNRLALVSALGHLDRLDQARGELDALIGICPGITRDFVRARYPMAETGYMDHLLAGLGKAGMAP